VAVVNRQNKTAIQARAISSIQSQASRPASGLLAFFEGNLLRGEVLADGTGRKRHEEFHEGVAVVADEIS